jgi:hypothetical protein
MGNNGCQHTVTVLVPLNGTNLVEMLTVHPCTRVFQRRMFQVKTAEVWEDSLMPEQLHHQTECCYGSKVFPPSSAGPVIPHCYIYIFSLDLVSRGPLSRVREYSLVSVVYVYYIHKS